MAVEDDYDSAIAETAALRVIVEALIVVLDDAHQGSDDGLMAEVQRAVIFIEKTGGPMMVRITSRRGDVLTWQAAARRAGEMLLALRKRRYGESL